MPQDRSLQIRNLASAFALYEVLIGVTIFAVGVLALDSTKEFKIDTGYGIVKLIQKNAPAGLTEPGNVQLSGINLVTLTAQWMRGGITQSKQISFYVYRPR